MPRHRLPAVASAERRLGDLTHPEELAAKGALRDFVVDAVFDPVNPKDPIIRLGVGGDDALVRPDLGFREFADTAAEQDLLLGRTEVHES